MKILITGAAGFIGFHLSDFLSKKGHEIYGIDNLNAHYSKSLKQLRFNALKAGGVKIKEGDISQLSAIYEDHNFDLLVNLAARPGARAAHKEYDSYIDSNYLGFKSVLDFCVKKGINKVIYASSSSVYGDQNKVPFKENDIIYKPKTIYAASKVFNENLSDIYSKNFGLTAIGLRFFSVFGEYGRPDMAYFSFLRDIESESTINLFNSGTTSRDFTHISDIIDGCNAAINYSISAKENEIFNLGNDNPIKVSEIINFYEKLTGKVAKVKNISYAEPKITHACLRKSQKKLEYNPKINVFDGLEAFYTWYKASDVSKMLINY